MIKNLKLHLKIKSKKNPLKTYLLKNVDGANGQSVRYVVMVVQEDVGQQLLHYVSQPVGEDLL